METNLIENYTNFLDAIGKLSKGFGNVTSSIGDMKDSLPALMESINSLIEEDLENKKKLSEWATRNKELLLVCDEMYKMICEHGNREMKGHAKELLGIREVIYREGKFL